MRTRIILQLATLAVILFGTSIEGLFFQYPKNALLEFFQSLHKKKEPKTKKPMQNIHHYHLHYYPVHTQVLEKPVRAPDKYELDSVYSNHLGSLGWSDKEFRRVPEPDIYRPSSLPDIWPESSLSRPWAWEDVPEKSNQSAEQEVAASKPSIIVQVPLHQNIIVHNPAPREEIANPLVSFFQKIKRIKNSLFTKQEEESEGDEWDRSGYNDKLTYNDKLGYNDKLAYVLYLPPENGRKL